MNFESGQRVKQINSEVEGIVQTADDWDEYELNKPSDKWVLVIWDNGQRTWVGNIWIKKI